MLSKYHDNTTIYMYQRVAYSHAINAGHSVEEYEPGGKAAEEIRALYKWIMKS
jgi:chromosome partitioning protein